ncbi:MAG: zf-HC2 domain-containing protein [Planctomycetota bacterium]|nr:zf-HC2 domain-containing protein [Planctomycetota bacterium]
MTTEQAANLSPACARIREDIPMLAVGGLSAEEAAEIRRHVDGCAECRQVYEDNRGVLELVRQESSPSVMLNSKRVLAELKRRMSEESRASYEPAPALTPRGRVLWLAGLVGVAAAACVSMALLLGPGVKTPHPVAKEDGSRAPVAYMLPPGAPKPKPVFKGDHYEAEAQGVHITYPSGLEGRLQDDARLHFVNASALEVNEGTAAFYVPPGIEGFQVRGTASNATAASRTGARFMLVAKGGPGGADFVKVAEGVVEVRGATGPAVRVDAGQGTRVSVNGVPAAPEEIDVVAAFDWVDDQSARNISCTFKAGEYPAPGALWLGTLAVRNTSEKTVTVAGFHMLGANYQLEIRREGEKTGYFTKLAPRVLRKRAAGGNAEPVLESSSEMTLEPGQSYELEVDLRGVVKEAGPQTLIAHYQVFSQPKATGLESKWGFALRSQAIKIFVPLNPEKRGR